MKLIEYILKHEINEVIAIIITKGEYDKGFYEGVLKEVNNDDIIMEIVSTDKTINIRSFKYDTFILATPLERYQ